MSHTVPLVRCKAILGYRASMGEDDDLQCTRPPVGEGLCIQHLRLHGR